MAHYPKTCPVCDGPVKLVEWLVEDEGIWTPNWAMLTKCLNQKCEVNMITTLLRFECVMCYDKDVKEVELATEVLKDEL